MRKTLFVLMLSLLFLVTSNVQAVFAANTTIGFSPQSGSYAAPFPVSLIIDGHGDEFNAAQATVTVSQNAMIKDLVLGDCNFSFLKTPSVADPSFEGAILGNSSKKCTVYTLTLSPAAKGTATISLTKASVRRFGDAAEVLASTQNGSYTLTGTGGTTSQTAQSQETPIPTPANGLYTVLLKILNSDATPVSNVSVTLTAVAGKTHHTAPTDPTGTALFSNLTPGVYTATVTKDSTQLAKTILNVTGANHVLKLSINIQAQQNNPLLKPQAMQINPFLIAGIVALGVLAGVGITILLTFLTRRKSVNGSL
jgi:hypothetical protein